MMSNDHALNYSSLYLCLLTRAQEFIVTIFIVLQVFDFIVQKLYALRKPKTSIQILQQNVLLKYKLHGTYFFLVLCLIVFQYLVSTFY
ncbi:hypothetical protein Patl1_07228 [Pistacia atlantica]|uniref:Uncharacterized protein n=1 Tax=Pistacia atlantica TaxID=434234 RepID=A0ACC1AG97_9ROSI|nr:hypothetical protein Patl1_07228 [Pistacia atlantica]